MIGIELPAGHALLGDEAFLASLRRAGARVIGITDINDKNAFETARTVRSLQASGFYIALGGTDGMHIVTDAAKESGRPAVITGRDGSCKVLNASGGITDGACLDIDDGADAPDVSGGKPAYVRVHIEKDDADALTRNILAFSFWYYGHYMLAGAQDEKDIFAKLDILKRSLPLYAPLYDDARYSFISRARRACSVLSGGVPEKGTYMGLIHSTSYAFSTNGMPWVMDIALRSAGTLTNAYEELPRMVENAEYMLVTHGHEDHFERETVACLKNCKMKWAIPHFLHDMALDFGLREEQLILMYPGHETKLGLLSVLPFEGQHYRPSNHVGLDELGYLIRAESAPTLVFPGDTRDFRTDTVPRFEDADWAFGHVWLSDEDSRIADRKGMDKTFAEHLSAFGAKGAVLAHLYEISRTDQQMWRYCHAGLVADRLRELDPCVKLKVPSPGDVIELERIEE